MLPDPPWQPYLNLRPGDPSLVHTLAARAVDEADRLAYGQLAPDLQFCGKHNFASLDRRARAIAAYLQERTAPGDRVLILEAQRLEYIEAFFGCLYAGVVAVPVYPPRPNRSLTRIQAIAADCTPRLALVGDSALELRERVLARAPELRDFDWIPVGAVEDARADTYRRPAIDGDTLAFLQYTSGSTGTPRGVMVRHDCLLHNQDCLRRSWHDTDSSMVSWLPFFHDMGLIGIVAQAVYAAVPCAFMAPMDFINQPLSWLEAISRLRARISGAPNFAYELLVQRAAAGSIEHLELSSWDVAFCGAEPIRAETLERFIAAFERVGLRRRALAPGYGLAENTLMATTIPPGKELQVVSFDVEELERGRLVERPDEAEAPNTNGARRLVGCGAPGRGQEVVIADPDTRARRAPGEIGEIWIAGPSVAGGYFRQPEASAATFAATLSDEGAPETTYLRTGDLGAFHGGELVVTGRRKDLIIVRGRNVYPQDLERCAAASHPQLRPDCGAAFAVDDGREERVVLVHECGRRVEDPDEVIGAIRRAVAEEFELELSVVVLVRPASIAKTSSGKIQRRLCRAQFLEGGLKETARFERASVDPEVEPSGQQGVAAVGEVRAFAVAALARAIECAPDAVQLQQSIYHYALDSLRAVELCHELSRGLGIEVVPAALLNASSLEQFLVGLEQDFAAAATAIASTTESVPERSRQPSAPAPLSVGQEALWFLEQLEEQSGAYNIGVPLELSPAVDVDALRRALERLVRRHAALRTRFPSSGGRPTRAVDQEPAFELRILDHAPAGRLELEALLQREAHRPFDLERGPLVRSTLLRREGAAPVLHLVLHHSIADLWSVAVLLEELGALYTLESGGEAELPPLGEVDDGAFARAQRDYLRSPAAEVDRAYWHARLGTDHAPLRLPTQWPRGSVQTTRGGVAHATVSAEVTTALVELGRRISTTVTMNALAGFLALLHRYCGREDIAVGALTAGRDRAELARAVGYFVNPVVLRSAVSPRDTLEGLAEQCRGILAGALTHQAYPFSELVRELSPDRDAGHTPLFQVLFQWQNSHIVKDGDLARFTLGEAGTRLQLDALEVSSVAAHSNVSQFDLALVLVRTEGGIRLALEYNADLFDARFAAQFLEHYTQVLATMASAPRTCVGAPELFRIEQDTSVDPNPSPRSDLTLVPERVCQVAERWPDRIAVLDGDRTLSYGELSARADAVAGALRARVNEAGARETVVALYGRPTPELVIGWLAVLRAGAAALVLDLDHPDERRRQILRAASPRFLLVTDEGAQPSPESGAALDMIALEREGAGDAGADGSATDPDSLAYLVFTSGSTGLPKGVMIPHGALARMAEAWGAEYGLGGRPRRHLQMAAPSFDVFVGDLVRALSHGDALVCCPRETLLSPPELLSLIRSAGIDVAEFVPSILRLVMDEAEASGQRLDTFELLIVGSEAFSTEDLRRLRAITPAATRLVNSYGVSEATIDSLYTELARDNAADESAPPLGLPFPGVELAVLDADLHPVPRGVPGELYLVGATLARGYVGRPDLTADRFQPSVLPGPPGRRMYRTGDRVLIRMDGQLEYLGRGDDQVKVRGVRVELAEVEAVLGSLANVRAAAVAAHPRAGGGVLLAGYVVPRSPEPELAARIRRDLAQRLPHAYVPNAIVELAELPRTTSGKLDRNALPAPKVTRPLVEGSSRPPEDELERLVCQWFAEVLGTPEIGVDDNFFACGGDSLQCIQVVVRARNHGWSLNAARMFQHQTPAQLAAHLKESSGSSTAPVQEPPRAETPPSVPLDGLADRLGLGALESVAPLTPVQEAMLLQSLLDPDAPIYFEQLAATIEGDLDLGSLRDAWRQVHRRHAVLRSGFLWEGVPQPLQVVAEQLEPVFEVVDLRNVTDPEGAFEAALRNDRAAGFDYAAPPLARLRVFLETDRRTRFCLSAAHILLDGWSGSLLLRELLSTAAGAAGSGAMPQPAPRPFVDYVHWLGSRPQDACAAHWQAELGDFEDTTLVQAALGRATQEPRLEVEGRHVVRTPEATVDGLVSLAKAARVTPATVFQAALGLVIGWRLGRKDVVFGRVVSGRNADLDGIDTMLGMFIHTVPFRVRWQSGQAVPDWLGALHARSMESAEFEHAALVDISRWCGFPGGERWFDAVFAYENYPLAALPWQGTDDLRLRDVRFFEQTGEALAICVEPALEHSITFSFDPQAFSTRAIQGLARDYLLVLERLARNPRGQLRDVLGDPCRETWWQANLATERPYPRDANLVELFREQVRLRPRKAAVRDPQGSLSYAELDRRSDELAAVLRSRGVRAEDRVAILLPRSRAALVAIFAVLKSGAAYLPLDPGQPAARLFELMEDAQAVLLITDAGCTLPAGGPPRLDAEGSTESEGSAPPLPAIEPTQLAYVMYTSGSTGKPKGVAVPHRAVIRLVSAQGWLRFGDGEVFAQLAPLAFDASTFEIFGALLHGATLAILSGEPPTARQLGEQLRQECVSTLFLTTGLLHQIVDEDGSVFTGLRHLVTGGDTLSPAHAARARELVEGGTVVNAYGPTEGAVMSLCHVLGPEISAQHPVPLGSPLANTRVYVLDEDLVPVPVGAEGDLWIAGDGLARGYLGDPARTAERFLPDPFAARPGALMYASGDRARPRGDGSFDFLGRRDGQVKVRGHRVELEEVEIALRSDPAVRDAAAVLLPEAQRIGAVVVLAEAAPGDGVDETPERLRKLLASRLPAPAVPNPIAAVEALPLRGNGKLDRRAISDLLRRRSAARRAGTAPRTRTERVVGDIWKDVLAVDTVLREDDFFELGGHSLACLRVLGRIRERLDIEVDLATLFECRTLQALAGELERVQGEGARDTGLAPLAAADRPVLSFSQERLWFLDQFEGGSAFYNIAGGYRLRGPLDREHLLEAIELVARRHEVLRTRFESEDGRPRLVVDADVPVQLEVLDLCQADPAEQVARMTERATADARGPFDIARGPLWRCLLVALGPKDHVLLLTLHHIIADGWSLGLWSRELAIVYEALRTGRRPELEPLALRTIDVAAWQREAFASGHFDEQLDFWRRTLAAPRALLDLPTDRPRGPVQTYVGRSRSLRLDAALVRGLDELVRREEVTLYTALLAGFQALLHRICGCEDLSIGTPVAGRGDPRFESLMGLFVNTVVVRTSVAANQRFSDLLAGSQQACLRAFQNTELPFEKVVDDLLPARDLSRNPLFDVMFTFDNSPDLPAALGEVRLEPFPVETGTANFDLTLDVRRSGAGLVASVEFNSDLFDPEFAVQFLNQYQRVLGAAVERPEQRLAELPLLSPREVAALTRFEAADAAPSFEPVHRAVGRRARERAAELAVIGSERSLTYAQLWKEASALAADLRARLGDREQIVAVLAGREVEAVVAVLGILEAGHAYLVLDPDGPAQRNREILADAEPALLLVGHPRYTPADPGPVPVMEMVRDAGDAPDAIIPAHTGPEPSEASLAYVIYTSGTTGVPKGVQITHGTLARAAHGWSARYGLSDRALTWLQVANHTFDVFTQDWVRALTHGGRLVLCPYELLFDSPALYERMIRDGIDAIDCTPTLLRTLLDVAGEREGLGFMRLLVVGAEPWNLGEMRRVAALCGPQTRLLSSYGITEATVDNCTFEGSFEGEQDSEGPAADGPVPLGVPFEHVRTYVLDDQLQLVPPGVPGELCLGGECLARGYLGRAALTASRFVPDPFSGISGARMYRSGDRVVRRRDGSLHFLGRLDHQIKLHGLRVELEELESRLLDHAGVRACAVALRGGEQPRLVAFFEASSGPPPTNTQLAAHLRASLPEALVPAAFVALPNLPRLPNGKLDRGSLPEAVPERAATGQGERPYQPPAAGVEATLATLWSELLGIPNIGADDNFFELGGDSISSIQLIARARARGLAFTPKEFFQHPTVSGLAGVLAAGSGAADRAEAMTGAVRLTPVQRWFLALELPQPDHWNQSVRLSLKAPLGVELVERALRVLVSHHGALRLRFERREGVWEATVGSTPAAPLVTRLDLTSLPDEERQAAIDTAVLAAQGGLHLESGRLLQALLIERGGGQRDELLWVIHHLVVDNVSWRILIDQFEQIVLQLAAGHPPARLMRSDSSDTWMRHVEQRLRDGAYEDEVGFWAKLAAVSAPPLPKDDPGGPNTCADEACEQFALSADQTRALLDTAVPDPESALLAALVFALGSYAGERRAWIEMEGHGREAAGVEADLSLTIGWFTCTYPLLLDLRTSRDLIDGARQARAALDAVPSRGLGFAVRRHVGQAEAPCPACPEISFNYLGRLDTSFRESSLFAGLSDDSGPERGPENPRTHVLDIAAWIAADALHVELRYSRGLHQVSSMSALLLAMRSALEDAPAAEQGQPPPGFRPDGVDQRQLAGLLDRLAKDRNG